MFKGVCVGRRVRVRVEVCVFFMVLATCCSGPVLKLLNGEDQVVTFGSGTSDNATCVMPNSIGHEV